MWSMGLFVLTPWLLIAAFAADVQPKASAVPVFRGRAADVEAAEFAWSRAIACTGWRASAHEEVWIERLDPGTGYGGGAWVDGQGLARVQLRPDVNHASVIWHEVAHAWANGLPAALTEGRAELLAACIGGTTPRVSRAKRSQVRASAADVDWNAVRSDDLVTRHVAYDRATQLVVAAAEGVPLPLLFPQHEVADWPWFEDLLREQAPYQGGFWEAIALLGPASALWDLDDDGLSNFTELRLGLDPFDWDTDNDGWWDGGEAPRPDAVPLRPDDGWQCSGWATGPKAVVVRIGQPVGRPHPATVLIGSGDDHEAPLVGFERVVAANRPVLLRSKWPSHLDGPATHWVSLLGEGLVVDPGCRRSAPFVTWPADRPGEVAFGMALAVASTRADRLLGPSTDRLEVFVSDGSTTWWDDGRVVLGTRDLAPAWDDGRFDLLAAHVVAMHRVWDAPDIQADLDLVESLAWALADDWIATPFSPFNTGEWALAARSCGDGWWGVINGFCEKPEL